MGTSRQKMQAALNVLLEPQRFQDFAPNGLQVEGRAQIDIVVSGVTASQALLNAAIALKADAVLVHHGYFWRSEDPCLVGMKGRRVQTLMQADINLFAYHLPLDCHMELGNNAGLGRALGVPQFGPLIPEEPTLPVFMGELPEVLSQVQVAESCQRSSADRFCLRVIAPLGESLGAPEEVRVTLIKPPMRALIFL